MGLDSRAEAHSEGALVHGNGRVSTASTTAFKDLPVSWSSRTEAHAGKTSPEELLAAAHASCFAMAFSSDLTKAGNPPERLSVSATVTFDRGDSGWSVAKSHLTVKGKVPGIDAAKFKQ